MRPFKRLLSKEVAMGIIRENVRCIDRVEMVPLENAAWRVLAEDFAADFDVPSFNRSAMDGYAVRAEDTYGSSTFSPKRLKLIGELHAVDQFDGEVGSGECVQVATGSPVPKGSDAVLRRHPGLPDGARFPCATGALSGSCQPGLLSAPAQRAGGA